MSKPSVGTTIVKDSFFYPTMDSKVSALPPGEVITNQLQDEHTKSVDYMNLTTGNLIQAGGVRRRILKRSSFRRKSRVRRFLEQTGGADIVNPVSYLKQIGEAWSKLINKISGTNLSHYELYEDIPSLELFNMNCNSVNPGLNFLFVTIESDGTIYPKYVKVSSKLLKERKLDENTVYDNKEIYADIITGNTNNCVGDCIFNIKDGPSKIACGLFNEWDLIWGKTADCGTVAQNCDLVSDSFKSVSETPKGTTAAPVMMAPMYAAQPMYAAPVGYAPPMMTGAPVYVPPGYGQVSPTYGGEYSKRGDKRISNYKSNGKSKKVSKKNKNSRIASKKTLKKGKRKSPQK